MQLSILCDRQYKTSACTALDTIRQCFRKRIFIVQAAYEKQIISESQLDAICQQLLAEAACILHTHPSSDPQIILFRLRTAAEYLDQQTRSLSVENCLSMLSG